MGPVEDDGGEEQHGAHAPHEREARPHAKDEIDTAQCRREEVEQVARKALL